MPPTKAPTTLPTNAPGAPRIQKPVAVMLILRRIRIEAVKDRRPLLCRQGIRNP